MSTSSRLTILLTALALVTETRSASAVELSWQAPQDCPSYEAIAHDIARLSGAESGQGLRALATVSRNSSGPRWRVVIELSGSAAGHRELTADNCAQLSRAAALIIALAANPEAALELPTEDPTALATPEADRATPPVAQPAGAPRDTFAPLQPAMDTRESGASSDTNRQRTAMTFDAFAALGYDSGSLPLGSGVLRVGVGLHYGLLASALSIDATQSKASEFVGGYGARFRAVTIQWLGCVEPWTLPVRASACLGPRLELLVADGYGSTENLRQRVWRPGGVAAIGLMYPIGSRLHVGANGELILQFRQPQFLIENVDTPLYEPLSFALRTLFVASVRL